MFFDSTRTLERKIKEVPAALALEMKFSKDEILSIYLNRAYLGAGATGFEAAAERYFGKSAAEVTPGRGGDARRAPAGARRASRRPTTSPARRSRAGTIVGLMEAAGLPRPPRRRSEARAQPAQLSAAAAARAGGAFADWVMSSGPDFLTRKTTEDVEVLTTFDPRLQRAAEAGLAAVFEEKVKAGSNAQAAIVVMSPDGAVRAMVGGRDFGGRRGPVQPRHPGAAADRLAVQDLRLRRGAAGGRQPARPGARRAAVDLHPRLGQLDAAELHARVPRRDHPGAGAGAARSTPRRCGSPRQTGRARVAAVAAGPRGGRADRRRAGDGARRLGGDAARDDRRLCRHPEPRGQRASPTGCARCAARRTGRR